MVAEAVRWRRAAVHRGLSANVDFVGRSPVLVYILLSFSHVLSSVQVLVVSESSNSSALLFGGQTPKLVVVPF